MNYELGMGGNYSVWWEMKVMDGIRRKILLLLLGKGFSWRYNMSTSTVV